MGLEDQLVNMNMTESELDAMTARVKNFMNKKTPTETEKEERAKRLKAEAQRRYQQNNKEKLAEYSRNYYNKNNEAKHKKKMLQAWNRYVDGVSVSNKIVDEMREYYKLTDREIPYRKPVY